jgi:DNA-binding XRE family transcriptional regulator
MAKTVTKIDKPATSTVKDEADFGLHIMYKRTQLNMSKQELADLCNINYQTVDNIEKGKLGTRLSSALYVASMLGVEIQAVAE